MDVFRGLADPLRREILVTLRDGGPRRVADLAAGFEVSRPAISRHLAVLASSGLIQGTGRGRERWYSLLDDGVDLAIDWLRALRPGRQVAPPVSAHALDALELEVRRTGKERVANEAYSSTTIHTRKGQTA